MREVFRHHGLILDGVCSKLRSYLQILVQKIIWSGYARYNQIYLLIYIKLNNHRRLMRIIIGFHPVLTLEIGYGYYDDISRLFDHAIKTRSRSEVEGSRLFGRIGNIPLDFRVF